MTAFYTTAAPLAADLMLSAAQAGSTLPTATSGKQAAEKIITWEPNSSKSALPFILDLSNIYSNSGGSRTHTKLKDHEDEAQDYPLNCERAKSVS